MQCEAVLGAIATGEPLSAGAVTHLEGCVMCRSARLAAAWNGGAATGPNPPHVPSPAAFRARARRQVAGRVAALVVVLVVGVGLAVGSRPDGDAPGREGAVALDSRPPIDLDAGLLSVLEDEPDDGPAALGAVARRDPLGASLFDDLAPDDPVGRLADPSDLFEAALLGEGSL